MKGLHHVLLIWGLLLLISTAPPIPQTALVVSSIDSESSSSEQGPALVSVSPETAATMFLLLFMTSLVGLYIGVRYLRHNRIGFTREFLRPETKVDRTPELERGEAYLVTQGQNRAMKVFSQELRKGHKGLCVSRTYPNKLKESWDLDGAQLYWLANEDGREEGSVNSLTELSEKVQGFLSAEEKGIILLDGVEYLSVQNSFTEVMKLLQSLKDAIPGRGHTLLIPIDLLALVERQRALLTREFRQI